MQFEKFFNSESQASKSLMHSRIANAVSSHSWQATIAYILENDLSFEQLKVIEVGCGSGTLSLILNLLGANTTLLDVDENALNLAREVFDLYGREASFIKANVIEDVPNKMLNSFTERNSNDNSCFGRIGDLLGSYCAELKIERINENNVINIMIPV